MSLNTDSKQTSPVPWSSTFIPFADDGGELLGLLIAGWAMGAKFQREWRATRSERVWRAEGWGERLLS